MPVVKRLFLDRLFSRCLFLRNLFSGKLSSHRLSSNRLSSQRLFLPCLFLFGMMVAHTSRAQVWFGPMQLPVQGLAPGLVWAGGFNSPQFSLAELDGRPPAELVVFDRSAASWLVFKTIGGSWVAAPDLAALLPPCRNWALLRDYDRDGRPDLFTDNRGSVTLYRNLPDPAGLADFQIVAGELASTSFAGGALPLYVTSTDLPGIADTDGDGDLDVLTFEASGAAVELHRNVAPAGAVPTFTKSACWGRFAQSHANCGQFTLGIACRAGADTPEPRPIQLPARPLAPMHTGSTLLPIDADADGDLDLLTSSVECNQVSLLTNGATAGLPAVITSYTAPWPRGGQPASFQLFPAGYAADFASNGRPSLLFAPNIYTPAGSEAPNLRRCVWLYQDRNTAGPPDYHFKTNAFLQEDMLDYGANAVPTWLDIDADGDQDLVLGTANRPTAQGLAAGLVWYTNTNGTLAVADTNLGGYLARGGRYTEPFTADLTGDGRPDLILMLPTKGGPRALLIPMGSTIGPDGTALRFAEVDTLGFTFFAGDAPAFVDTDGDGDLDMVLGRDDGSLGLVTNIGTPQRPAWGSLQRNFLGYSGGTTFSCRPAVADIDGNQTQDLLVTTGTTPPCVYLSPLFVAAYRAHPDTLLYQNNTLGRGSTLPSGFFSAPAFADLDGDTRPDLSLGLGTGGVQLFANQVGQPLSTRQARKQNTLATLLENPSTTLKLWVAAPAQLRIADALGKTVYTTSVQGGVVSPLLPMLPAGVYLLEVKTTQGRQVLQWVRH